MHFLHTPFADPTCSACCPTTSRRSCLTAWPAIGACGFHCHRWEAGFRACFAAAGRPAPPTFVAPLGPDAEALEAEATSPGVRRGGRGAAAEVGGRRTVVRVDRMEPSKNIVRGMLAFEELLHAHPEWRGEVVHVAMAYPSRQGLAEYLAYAADVAHTAERINHAFGSGGAGLEPDGWTPIVLSSRTTGPLARRAARLGRAARQPGARRAQPGGQGGPAAQHGRRRARCSRARPGRGRSSPSAAGGALGVNPFDVSATAEALHAALVDGAVERAGGRPPCAPPCAARTSADWWADQLAAARRRPLTA